jgi:hypothetical protein
MLKKIKVGTAFDIIIIKKQYFLIPKVMKQFIITTVLATMVTFGTRVMAQEYPAEYLGLPGDNLNLYAVMKLFQESRTLEEFERNLNDENFRINNLDLNGDNLIDYLMVADYPDRDVHTIVLRSALGRDETQDVAVFTVQRYRDGSARIQLIGDEALYGRNYIIEPIYEDLRGGTPNPGYSGRQVVNDVTVVRISPFEVAAWPIVRSIYLPNYIAWRSAWRWGYLPPYWHPWRPLFWHYYYGYHYNWYNTYYGHYRLWDHYRYPRYDSFYYKRIRTHSPLVILRTKQGGYRTTYSHPEQRREGEALFLKMNPGHSRRTNDYVQDNRVRRGNVTPPARERSVITPSGNQRPTRDRSVITPSDNQRPTRSTDRRYNNSPSRETRPDVSHGSAPVINDRNAARTPDNNKASTVNQSSPSDKQKVARPASKSSGESVRVQKQTTTKETVTRRERRNTERDNSSKNNKNEDKK